MEFNDTSVQLLPCTMCIESHEMLSRFLLKDKIHFTIFDPFLFVFSSCIFFFSFRIHLPCETMSKNRCWIQFENSFLFLALLLCIHSCALPQLTQESEPFQFEYTVPITWQSKDGDNKCYLTIASFAKFRYNGQRAIDVFAWKSIDHNDAGGRAHTIDDTQTSTKSSSIAFDDKRFGNNYVHACQK